MYLLNTVYSYKKTVVGREGIKKGNYRIRNVTVIVKASCSNFLWEMYIGVSGQGGALIGPSPLLKK